MPSLGLSIAGASLLLLLLGGCGASSEQEAESPVIAQVADTTISEADIRRALPMVWPMSPALGGSRTRPPRYTACVNARRRDGSTQGRTFLRAQCEEIYDEHVRTTISTLIVRTWARKAAHAKGLEPTDEMVARAVDRQLRSVAPTAAGSLEESTPVKARLQALIRERERNRRLVKALDTTPGGLNSALAKLYGHRTTCSSRYEQLPECAGKGG